MAIMKALGLNRMKLINLVVFISLIVFSQCSLIESVSFYETFINPDISSEISKDEDLSDGQTPDIESVPKN